MTKKRFTLGAGQWFMYPLQDDIPSTIIVYEGSAGQRREVARITKMQALALARWHEETSEDAQVREGDNWVYVHVVGDTEAFYGDEEE